MVYLPRDFDKNKKYPLLVFLHGSDSDESNIVGANVQFITEPGKGHGEPSKENLKKYYSWVKNVIKQNKTL